MKTIDDTVELRGRIFGAFELAELERLGVARTAIVASTNPTDKEMSDMATELHTEGCTRNGVTAAEKVAHVWNGQER